MRPGRPTLLLGAGYLARFVVAALAPAAAITCVRRTPPAAVTDARAAWLAADVTASADVAALAAQLAADPRSAGGGGDVVFMLPPSALGNAAPADALAPLLAMLVARDTRRAVLVSSSGIYDADDDTVVSAASVVAPRSSRAMRLAAIESTWTTSGLDVSVLRLAGIYGPGRVIGRASVRAGTPLPGAADAWLNLIHVTDAARAIVAALDRPAPLPVALIADGNPVRRGDYYGGLAALLGAPPPRFDGASATRGGSKRCDPTASWQALDCVPAWPHWRRALAVLVADADAG
ncbi:MAG: NAD-dependent epimerase/dehydratase family protein [Gammaproteobacteria bacterium]